MKKRMEKVNAGFRIAVEMRFREGEHSRRGSHNGICDVLFLTLVWRHGYCCNIYFFVCLKDLIFKGVERPGVCS